MKSVERTPREGKRGANERMGKAMPSLRRECPLLQLFEVLSIASAFPSVRREIHQERSFFLE